MAMNVTTDEATRQVITSMAERLQEPAAEALRIYITGTRLSAGLDIVALVLTAAATWFASKKAYESGMEKAEDDHDHPYYDENDAQIKAMFVGMGAVLVAGFFFVLVASRFEAIILPEYTVMREVVTAVAN